MDDEIRFFLTQCADERATHRKREAFLMSVIIHLIFVILILLGPKLFPSGLWQNAPPREVTRIDASKNLGFLALPKDYQKLFQRPKTPALSDKDRIAQGKAPMIDPRGIRAPYSKGDTKLPEQSSPRGTPPAPTPPPVASVANPSNQDTQQQQGGSKEENNQLAKLQVPASSELEAGETKTSLRDLFAGLQTPGSSIQSSLERARQSGNLGYGGSGSGDSVHQFGNRQPNFSVDQPTILSDTRGVDFGPWLRLIYFRVRDNWYSVIPELIRSGTKAKVVVMFDIMNNGRIENLQIVRSSGLSPYDRAAVSSLKLSEPFPNFPVSFSGDRITLQFSYFYNIRL
jgi:TonB family protein